MHLNVKMDSSHRTALLAVIVVFLAAGCTSIENEVCKGRESFSLDFGGKIVSVESACDECVSVLAVSGQSARCLETKRTMTAFKESGGSVQVPSKHKYYPHLLEREDDWDDCSSIGDDAEQLKCGCCLLQGTRHKYESGRGCYNIISKERRAGGFGTTVNTKDVPQSSYYSSGRCR